MFKLNKKILFASIGYIIFTFIVAVVWHVVIFKKIYEDLGYFSIEPDFILGFLTVVIQGYLLSAFYEYLKSRMELSVINFILPIGLFFWTSHVLAFMAKQMISNPLLFIGMESFYLMLQFGLYAVILHFIYKQN